jgi:type II secretory pathway component PulF
MPPHSLALCLSNYRRRGRAQLEKDTKITSSLLYPVGLPIVAITPWWAFAKYVLKLNMSEYKNMGYFLLLAFFICGIAITIWNRKIAGSQKEQKLIAKMFTGYGKAFVFTVVCQFVLIFLIGIFLLIGI